MLNLRLFGKIIITRIESDALLELKPSKNTEVLAYIVMSSRKMKCDVGRDKIAELFWNDSLKVHNVNQALYSLRNVLSENNINFDDVILSNRKELWFNRQRTSCDFLEFENKLIQAKRDLSAELAHDLLRALRSYDVSSFMAAFSNDWIEDERASLVARTEQAISRLETILAKRHPNDIGQSHDSAFDASLDIEPRDGEWKSPSDFRFSPIYDPGFFGRDAEISVLCGLIIEENIRLVTLTGMGGIGKTRLAVYLGELLAHKYNVGGTFTSFAAVYDASLVLAAIARTLGISDVAGTELRILEQIAQVLGRSRHLLVLDNFEHLAASGANLVSRLIQALPNVTVLVVSRQLLQVTGEQELPLLGLLVPNTMDDLAEACLNPSVALFRARLRKRRPFFVVNAKNVRMVIAICQRLEGIPLAIELIASLGREDLSYLLRALDQRFNSLALKWPRGEARHYSLQAALDTSYDALSPDIQRFFDSLSVFEDGCTVAAAAAVSSEARAALYLGHLVSCSLLISDSRGTEPRYRLLETLREFGDQHVKADVRAALMRTHTEFFTKLGMEALPYLQSAQEGAALARLEADRRNIYLAVSALVGHAKSENIDTVGGLIQILGYLWTARGRLDEGRAVLDSLLAVPARDSSIIPSTLLAILTNVAGVMAERQGDYDKAQHYFEQSLVHAKSATDRSAVCNALGNLGLLAWNRQELDKARDYFERSLVIDLDLDNSRNILITKMNLANVYRTQGDLDTARHLNQENLEDATAAGDQHGIAWASGNLGQICRIQNQLAVSHRYCRTSLDLLVELDDQAGVATMLEEIAYIKVDQGDCPSALQLLSAATAIREALESPRPPIEQVDFDRYRAAAYASLSEDAANRAWGAGQTIVLEDAVAIASEEIPL